MKLRKYSNKQIGAYHTHTVNNIYEAMYASKYHNKLMKDKHGLDSTQTKMYVQKFKAQEKKHGTIQMLFKNKIQVIEPNTKPLPNFNYIRRQNDKWSPIIPIKENNMTGGRDSTCVFKENIIVDESTDNQVTNPKEDCSNFDVLCKAQCQDKQCPVVCNQPIGTTKETKIKLKKLNFGKYSKETEKKIYYLEKKKLVEKIQVLLKYFRYISKDGINKKFYTKSLKSNSLLKIIAQQGSLFNLVKFVNDSLPSYAFIELFANNDVFENVNENTTKDGAQQGGATRRSQRNQQVEQVIEDAFVAEFEQNTNVSNDYSEGVGNSGSEQNTSSVSSEHIDEDEVQQPMVQQITRNPFGFFKEFFDDNNEQIEQNSYTDSEDESVTWEGLEEEHLELEEDYDFDPKYVFPEDQAGITDKIKKILKYCFFGLFFVLLFNKIFDIYMGNSDPVEQRSLSSVFDFEPKDHMLSNKLYNPYYNNVKYNISFYKDTTTKKQTRKLIVPEHQYNNVVFSLNVMNTTVDTNNVAKLENLIQLQGTSGNLPPECSIQGIPETVTEQLLIHRDNMLVYFMDLMRFDNQNKSDKKILPLTESKDLDGYEILSITNYTKYFQEQNKSIPKVVKNFSNFLKKFEKEENKTSSMKVKEFFENLINLDAYKKEIEYFKDKMRRFKTGLLEYYKNLENGLEYNKHSCTINPKINLDSIEIPITPLTVAKVDNVITANQQTLKISIDQVKQTVVPYVEKLFELYTELVNKKPCAIGKKTKDLQTKLDKSLNDIKIPEDFFKDGKTDQEKLAMLENIFTELTKINENFGSVIDEFKANTKVGQSIEIFNYMMGVSLSQANITTQSMFDNLIHYNEPVKSAASSIAYYLWEDSAPEYIYTVNDVGSMIVKEIYNHALTTGDEITIKYIIQSHLAKLVYSIFTDQIHTLLDNVIENNAITTIIKNGVALFNYVDTENKNQYFSITKRTMKTLETKMINIHNKLNTGIEINDGAVVTYRSMMDIFNSYMNGKSTVTNVLNIIGKNIAKDFVRLKLEIEKLEMAIIILDFQNKILGYVSSQNQINPQLLSDPKFIGQLNKENSHYLKKIAEKNLVIMSLLEMQRYTTDSYSTPPVENTKNTVVGAPPVNSTQPATVPVNGTQSATTYTPQHSNVGQQPGEPARFIIGTIQCQKPIENTTNSSQGGSGHNKDDLFLMNSFIENAKKHNKTVMGNVNKLSDIDEKLKRKLIKSFIKHNQVSKKKILKFEKQNH